MSFLVDSLGFFYIDDYDIYKQNSFISSFPICIPFVSISYLIAWTQTYSMTSKQNSERGHPCPLPDLVGKALSFLPSSMMLVAGLFCVDILYQVKKLPSIPSIQRVFIMNGYWVFFKCFLCICWYNHVIFVSFLGY